MNGRSRLWIGSMKPTSEKAFETVIAATQGRKASGCVSGVLGMG